MREEVTGVVVLKLIGFTGMLLQVDTMVGVGDTFKYLNSFGVLGVLVIGIRYFISELKRQQKEFSEKWKEQEDRHSLDKDKERALHLKENELNYMKIENLTSEIIELKIKVSKFE